MICTRCGANIPDGAPCACGMPGGGPYSSNPAVNLIKRLGASKLFFVMVLLSTIGFVISTISTLMISPKEMLENILREYPDLYPLLQDSIAEGGGYISMLLGMIIAILPGLLVTVGMWLFHASCKNISTGGVQTTGLSMIRTAMIIILVLFCTFFGLVFIILVISVPFLSPDVRYNGIDTVTVVVIALILIVIALMIFLPYLISLIKTLSNIRAVCLNGAIHRDASQFLIVMNYIFGGILLLSGLSELTANPFGALSTFITAVSLILFSLLLSAYRREVNRILHSQAAVPPQAYMGYGQPGAQQQYPQNVQYPQNTQGQPYTPYPPQQYQQPPVQNPQATWQQPDQVQPAANMPPEAPVPPENPDMQN